MDLPKNETFRIGRTEKSALSNMSLSHVHDYYEIYYLISGNRRYLINNTVYNMSVGDVVMINKGDLHMTSSISLAHQHERFLLSFSDEFFDSLGNFEKKDILECFDTKKIHISLPKRYAFEGLLNKMYLEFNTNDKFSRFLAASYLYEILIFLNRYSKQEITASNNILNSDDKIQHICKYVCNNYNQQITLGDASKMAYMNPTYFSKKFKKVTGFGFNEYLNNIRIKTACNLLSETMYSVSDIAYLCGYKDSNYFGDVFKKLKGVSPSKYRKQNDSI